VYERVKRLENEGFIKRYVAVLDPEKLNLGLTAYVSVKLINHSFEVAQEFAAQMMKYPEVTECYNISGASDYLLKVYAKNMAGYRRFIIETIGRINVVAHIDSTFVMGEIKQTTQIPIDTESATVEEQ
jgi:Lrp/AsnC family leucine-responsive transcriptional regulator